MDHPIAFHQPADESLLHRVVEQLRPVDGLVGIVLGGSRANGTHTAESDFDIGLFYRDEASFDLAALGQVATAIDDDHRPNLTTAIGGWGPWVVGGGWLKVDGRPVDFIYRELPRVASVIHDCRNGIIDIGYQPAYTTGYVTTTYMAEVDACRVLWDPSGEIAALKALTRPYPEALKRAMLGQFGWVPRFALGSGRKCVPRADVTFASSMVYWAAISLCELLFAVNGQYLLNHKGAVALVESLPVHPANFRSRTELLFASLAASSTALGKVFDELEAIVDDVEQIDGVVLR